MIGRLLLPGLLLAAPAAALTIDVRYDYDSNGFFDQPGAREALQSAADFLGEMLHDSLDSLIQPGGANTWSATFNHPGTGAPVERPGWMLRIPADTVVVFVGARNLGGGTLGVGGPGGFRVNYADPSWYRRVQTRGEVGALLNPARDFGPWGGSISFDLDRDWHFRTDGRPTGSRSDFVSIALHELLHVLGFGTSDSFDARVFAGAFRGADAMAAWGGPVPLNPGASHWRDDGSCRFPLGFDPDGADNVLSTTFGSFGRAHGLDQIALMDPVSCLIGSQRFLQVATDLDLAALRDIGWEVIPAPRLESETLSPAGSDFSWPTITGIDYRLEQSTSLGDWTAIAGPQAGDGSVRSLIGHVPSPPSAATFFRLRAARAPLPALRSLAADAEPAPLPGSAERAPRHAAGCGHHIHLDP